MLGTKSLPVFSKFPTKIIFYADETPPTQPDDAAMIDGLKVLLFWKIIYGLGYNGFHSNVDEVPEIIVPVG